ncbi:hypothetical protein CABS01_13767 [Colletotrichum abscissum]|uniref:Uncharacterized protein n=1 Tax=Colletotrichum abscissum TaxID=1671311 RepID=A0A9Q0B9T9_9PEZI|nr:uncharacterized protein CABS01_13767 [Colletotrichum abscissum]KAI3558843.1 hypothetical protein CABS02_00883 [Colletotrichum abscissum]KAK1484344.1 hypothetical protein CABS01_13767 [Colletotrichum abscissum]
MRLPNLLVVAMLLGLGATAALPVEDVTDMTDFEDVANDALAKPPPHKVEKPWMMWGMCAIASNQCIIHGPHGERRYQCKNFVLYKGWGHVSRTIYDNTTH